MCSVRCFYYRAFGNPLPFRRNAARKDRTAIPAEILCHDSHCAGSRRLQAYGEIRHGARPAGGRTDRQGPQEKEGQERALQAAQKKRTAGHSQGHTKSTGSRLCFLRIKGKPRCGKAAYFSPSMLKYTRFFRLQLFRRNEASSTPDSLPRTASGQRLHESSPAYDGPAQETRTRWVFLFLQYRHSISGKKAHRLKFSEPARNDVPPFRLQPCPAVSCPCGRQQSPSATAIQSGRVFGRS